MYKWILIAALLLVPVESNAAVVLSQMCPQLMHVMQKELVTDNFTDLTIVSGEVQEEEDQTIFPRIAKYTLNCLKPDKKTKVTVVYIWSYKQAYALPAIQVKTQ